MNLTLNQNMVMMRMMMMNTTMRTRTTTNLTLNQNMVMMRMMMMRMMILRMMIMRIMMVSMMMRTTMTNMTMRTMTMRKQMNPILNLKEVMEENPLEAPLEPRLQELLMKHQLNLGLRLHNASVVSRRPTEL